jgi:hypothetical protein
MKNHLPSLDPRSQSHTPIRGLQSDTLDSREFSPRAPRQRKRRAENRY